MTAQSTFPFEEEQEAATCCFPKIPTPIIDHEPRARSAAMGTENEWDSRLQGMIDHWE